MVILIISKFGTKPMVCSASNSIGFELHFSKQWKMGSWEGAEVSDFGNVGNAWARGNIREFEK